MSDCVTCNDKRSIEHDNFLKDCAKERARKWAVDNGYRGRSMVIIRTKLGNYGFRAPDADLGGLIEVERVYVP